MRIDEMREWQAIGSGQSDGAESVISNDTALISRQPYKRRGIATRNRT
jgi:hypothetical protein